ncbi:MAG TPA: tRNA guanosine(15) transglycosylase TgtA [Thermoplasmata archaeon]|nr:tRNA guanosine(15) transglycosylase TgtA [Thermoplasmata archaeon]
MSSFELLERDGLARLGRLATPHGPIETPALLPVLHPDPARQPAPASFLRDRLGVRAVITSAYITWRTPPLRTVAERDGLHRLLGFDGPVMTDSGAFQQHAYGSVEVGPDEILDFQNRIGSDIATVLDVFTEPESPPAAAAAALAETEARTVRARAARVGLLAAPVQGALHPDLRYRAAVAASAVGDVLAVGGVVPLFERYRFAELARLLAAARPGLSPAAPVHLFGAGHPMTFALGALFGVDLFDSSAYLKFARRGDAMFPDGTVGIEELREEICGCALCAETPLVEVAKWPPAEREARLAVHNLDVSLREIARIRQAIRDGTLWELVERRATAHPAVRAGLLAATERPETFLPTEPDSRRAFRETGEDSARRPAVVRFRERLAVYAATRVPARSTTRRALRPEYLHDLPTRDRDGDPIHWTVDTPLGPVPLELTDLYPVGPYLGLEEFTGRAPPPRGEAREASDDTDWTAAWTERQLLGLLEWEFGPAAAPTLARGLRGERSRRTGRLRTFVDGHEPLFVVGTDGVPRPTFAGGRRLHDALGDGARRVVVAPDAVPFVRSGRSLFSRFAAGADPALVPGASALLVDPDDALLAVGRLVLAPHEMGRLARGVAVRVTAHADRPVPPEDLELELRDHGAAVGGDSVKATARPSAVSAPPDDDR